ncbi:MAG TPA: large conductance mechanosensitive channel protein MscL [Flavobacterium sp.]|jgi:large conductance mechanosensitive channel|nr:large conductance mechanosensitive channel protein MscL [Flavobacterium sp.]HQV35696.1 large conductance mechanosensitive channel protein MscL [Flavobacterium sp.]HQX02899.1 large conductance mechanosensitive channel protein MscL [Flavobacterium sp.]HRZ31959.1 large conductance mechanosensitive channel protein MscL [Flavobacterium sp.]HRZ74565.1 large conductance mechanosensitive channel protein MscL [Flavobacterium sp.]
MFKEFKNFIMTGNVIEFAVAVIMAGAVGAVVNGFVNDIVMPIVGMLTGGVDFSEMKVVLQAAIVESEGVAAVPEVAIRWGAWVNTLVNLVIVGFVMFMIIKAYNKMKKPKVEAPAAPAGPTQEELLAEIRDLLKK